MRLWIPVAVALVAAAAAVAQTSGPPAYQVEIDKESVQRAFREENGQRGLYVTVRFRLRRASDKQLALDVTKDEILVTEDGQRVEVVEIFQPKVQDVTTVLALDVSGSMEVGNKFGQAQNAARTFLERLGPRSDSGLVFFNDKVIEPVSPPVRDSSRFDAHRRSLRNRIDAIRPHGGTAYLDATSRAVDLLRDVPGRRAVVVMTDGLDQDSKKTLDEVVLQAQKAEIPLYTLGIGEPGKKRKVTTLVVLDQSGSMRDRANESDDVTKMEALHEAGCRFIDWMKPDAVTALLPFSDHIGPLVEFTTDKPGLKEAIRRLTPQEQTRLYDAVHDGLDTLAASKREGRLAVVAMTDGMDTGSRRKPQAIINTAQRMGIPVFMLGFGAKQDLNEKVMREIAQKTGGQYYYAGSKKALVEIFERLAVDLQDEGIDEKALKVLADQTGGKYIHVRDAAQLTSIFEVLADELQTTYTVTYRSLKASHDGTARGVDVSVVRGGVRVGTGSVDYTVQGAVVPELNERVYLVLLAGLLGLLALPSGLRRLYRMYGGA